MRLSVTIKVDEYNFFKVESNDLPTKDQCIGELYDTLMSFKTPAITRFAEKHLEPASKGVRSDKKGEG